MLLLQILYCFTLTTLHLLRKAPGRILHPLSCRQSRETSLTKHSWSALFIVTFFTSWKLISFFMYLTYEGILISLTPLCTPIRTLPNICSPFLYRLFSSIAEPVNASARHMLTSSILTKSVAIHPSNALSSMIDIPLRSITSPAAAQNAFFNAKLPFLYLRTSILTSFL